MNPRRSMGRMAGGRFELTRLVSWAFTWITLAFVVAMGVLFVAQGLPIWRHAGLGFLTGTTWFYRARQFGVLPMVYSTAVAALLALLLATPVALGAAVFTAELLPHRLRLLVKVPIELLAGVPSVVYGLLGVLLLRNWIYRLLEPWDPLSGDTLLTAGVLLAIMVLPTVMTLADDALRGVPSTQRQAARGLGLTSTQTVVGVLLPQALPGLAAAVLLGLGRGLGETIAVFLVIGRQDNQWPEHLFSVRPLARAGQTLTSKLGGSETFIAYGDPLHWGAMVGLALVLLGLVLAVTLLGVWLEHRWRRHA